MIACEHTPGGGSPPGAPRIASVSPDTVSAGADGFTLVIRGTGFQRGAVVTWNGSARATVYVSATQLAAVIPAADIAVATSASVTVANPAPAAQPSNTAVVYIRQPTTRLVISPHYPSLFANDTTLLTARLVSASGDTTDPGPITWTTADPTIATVAANGVVTGVAPGFAVIEATSGSSSGIATVAVIASAPRVNRRLAFLLGEPDSLGHVWFRVALANADGTEAVRVTPSGEQVSDFAWSPDGSRLMVTSYRIVGSAGYPQPSYTIRPDGSDRRFFQEVMVAPDWSPDGTRMVYGNQAGSGESDVYVVGADGGGRTRLTSLAGDEVEPQWSPDGRQIVFLAGLTAGFDRDIWVMAADGSDQREIRTPARMVRVRWSPDGKHLVASSQDAIWIVPSTGGAARVVSSGCGTLAANLCSLPPRLDRPAWSPDGRKISFGRSSDHRYLAVVDLATGAETNLDAEICCASDVVASAWSPDGSLFAYESTKVGSAPWPAISIARSDGSNGHFVTGDYNAFGPHWQP